MSKASSILIYLLIPPAIIILSVINARVVANNYLGQELGLAQYNAIISSEATTIQAETDQQIEIWVNVKNEGAMTWLSDSEKGIYLSYHVYVQADDSYLYEGERTALPEAVRPGEAVDLLLILNAPPTAGAYHLEIDMVHEEVTWFKKAGSNTYTIEMTITD